jgi:protein kinase-like protein
VIVVELVGSVALGAALVAVAVKLLGAPPTRARAALVILAAVVGGVLGAASAPPELGELAHITRSIVSALGASLLVTIGLLFVQPARAPEPPRVRRRRAIQSRRLTAIAPIALPERASPTPPEVVPPISEPRPPAPSVVMPAVGTHVGRYLLLAMVGEGAMGAVFRAHDPGNPSPVALKVLRPEWALSADVVRRFQREARLLAELENTYIARFIEVDQHEGIHYLAMELVEGTSLAKELESGRRLPVEAALAIVTDVARALADVHELGVVHRDLKPANILLVDRGGNGAPAHRHAKLCDFGVARELRGVEQDATMRGLAIGTPAYMSPEQCVGADVDTSSDIYALGITLYKMLSGRVPFLGKDWSDTVLQHLTARVPDIRGPCPELDSGVLGLLERMLAKRQCDRIANGRALLDELNRLQRGELGGAAETPVTGNDASVLAYDLELELRSAPAALWPRISCSRRLTRALGVAPEPASGSPLRAAVVRELSAGPLSWLRNTIELEPRARGTLLRQRVELALRSAVDVATLGDDLRGTLTRTYRRIDDACSSARLEVDTDVDWRGHEVAPPAGPSCEILCEITSTVDLA